MVSLQKLKLGLRRGVATGGGEAKESAFRAVLNPGRSGIYCSSKTCLHQ